MVKGGGGGIGGWEGKEAQHKSDVVCSMHKHGQSKMLGPPCRSGRGKYPSILPPRGIPCSNGTVRHRRSFKTAVCRVGREGKGWGGEGCACTCLTCRRTARVQGHKQRESSASGHVPASPAVNQGRTSQHSTRLDRGDTRTSPARTCCILPPVDGGPPNALDSSPLKAASRSCTSGQARAVNLRSHYNPRSNGSTYHK